VSSAFDREVQSPLAFAGLLLATLLAGILQYQIAWCCSVPLFTTRKAVVLYIVDVRAIPILVLPLLLLSSSRNVHASRSSTLRIFCHDDAQTYLAIKARTS